MAHAASLRTASLWLLGALVLACAGLAVYDITAYDTPIYWSLAVYAGVALLAGVGAAAWLKCSARGLAVFSGVLGGASVGLSGYGAFLCTVTPYVWGGVTLAFAFVLTAEAAAAYVGFRAYRQGYRPLDQPPAST